MRQGTEEMHSELIVGAGIPNAVGILMVAMFRFLRAFGVPMVVCFDQNSSHFVKNYWKSAQKAKKLRTHIFLEKI